MRREPAKSGGFFVAGAMRGNRRPNPQDSCGQQQLIGFCIPLLVAMLFDILWLFVVNPGDILR
jgi:hypothetical protein